jgi:pimeloyl-ACP methyl ester carboxylesterase
MRRSPLLPFAAALTLLAACSDQSVTAPASFAPTAAARDASSVWASTVTGETGPGSRYALYMPASWNGDVVVYAHGIKPAFAPVELPTGDGFPAVRDALGALGYAVAYSSFSENGWALKDGAQRTHQLSGLFTATFGKPDRTYLMGTSLGGLIVEEMAERFAGKYDGVFAMCAPLAGTKTEIEYIANVRVLFDLFYPGVVPGDVLTVPPGVDFDTQVQPRIIAAVMANPTGLGIIARLAQTPLAGPSPTELLTSLIYALKYDFIGIDDFLGRTHGHSMFDNSGTVYSAAAPGLLPDAVLQFINGSVGRFTSTPDAAHYLAKYYQPTGDVSVPTLTLHTVRDPLVPFSLHERPFADLVGAANQSPLLLQRGVDTFGHCTFTTQQMVDGFQALAGWVETGVKPAS